MGTPTTPVAETTRDKGAAFFDAVHNRFGPLGSGFDITRSDPAFDSLGLELMANRVCYRLVLGGDLLPSYV
jgi:hypothetical protein